LAIAAFGTDIWVTIQLFQSTSVVDLSKPSLLPVTGSVVQGLCAFCDIIITATLIFHLRSKRTGIPATENLIDKLTLYAITRGVLTAICQLTFMSLNLGFPGKTYWIPFHLIVSKLYVNSVLSSLNVRKAVRRPAVRSEEDFSLKILGPQSHNGEILGSAERKYSGTSDTSNSGGSKAILPVTVTTPQDTFLNSNA